MEIEHPSDPRGLSAAADTARRRLPADIAGYTVGLLDNSKAGAGAIVDILGDELVRRHRDVKLVRARKLHASLPISEALRAELDGVDLVVGALGDCGSCSSWLIHDAVELERAGVAVIAVCSGPFAAFARAQAAALGMPDLRILVVEHPIAELSLGEIRERVAAASAQFDELLARQVDDERPTEPASDVDAVVRAEVAEGEVFDYLAKLGITDGLPLVEPTVERVDAMIAGCALGPDTVLGTMAPKYGLVTVRAAATVAVMAGCLPEYFPIVLAALRAMLSPEFNLGGIQATTHPVTALVLVSGPIAEKVGMNSGRNAFGQGNRANATIGRAVRLAMIAIGGGMVGDGDMATHGSPGKYTFAAAENVDGSPWESLAESMGFPHGESVVIVVGAEEPQNVNDHESSTGIGILRMISGTMRSTGINNPYYENGQILLAIGPEHASTIARDGYSRRDVQQFVVQESRIPIGYFSQANIRQRLQTRFPREFSEFGPHTTVPVVHSADNVLVCVVGGQGKHSMFIPTFGATRASAAAVDEFVAVPPSGA